MKSKVKRKNGYIKTRYLFIYRYKYFNYLIKYRNIIISIYLSKNNNLNEG